MCIVTLKFKSENHVYQVSLDKDTREQTVSNVIVGTYFWQSAQKQKVNKAFFWKKTKQKLCAKTVHF